MPPWESWARPSVAVDLAVLTVTEPAVAPKLAVLVQHRSNPDGWALPGAFIRERATVRETMADIFQRKIRVSPVEFPPPVSLAVFDEPDRDPRGWVITLGHWVAVGSAHLTNAVGELVPIPAAGALVISPSLLFDHDRIVAEAVAQIRLRYEIRYRDATIPDPDGLLPEPFTLHQLRMVHQAVLGEELHKDNFNRRMRSMLQPVLEADGRARLSVNLRGAPAALFKKRR